MDNRFKTNKTSRFAVMDVSSGIVVVVVCLAHVVCSITKEECSSAS